ncbi:unnamed protein product, partial [Adineta steineri]
VDLDEALYDGILTNILVVDVHQALYDGS